MSPDDLDAYLDPVPRARRPNYDDLIQKHAQRTGLDPELVRAVVGQESGGNPRAVSPKGAKGLGQLMPATARRFGVRDVNDPDENLRGTTDYLKFLNDKFKGNRDLVLAGYNAGEGAVEKSGNRVPPYRETQNYVKSINARLGQRQSSQKPSDDLDSYLDPSPGQTPPATPRRTQSATSPAPAQSVPSITDALDALTASTNRATKRLQRQATRQSQRPAEPSISDTIVNLLKPVSEPSLTFTEDRAQRVAAKEAAQRTGMGGLHRLDDPEVERVMRLQQEQRNQNPILSKIREGRLTADQARRAAGRASTERAAEIQRQQDEPEIQRLTEAYRDDIRKQGLPQWLTETLSRGGAGVGEFGVGIGKLFAPLTRDPQAANQRLDALRKHAEAMTRAAVAEGADRNVVSRTIQDATAGFIASTPELAAIMAGAPPIGTFGAGGGIRALGRGENAENIMKATGHGLATGLAFEAPVPSRLRNSLARAVTKGATVGGVTTGINLAAGATPQQAISSGLTNAVFAGLGEPAQSRSLTEVRSEFPVGSRWRNPQWKTTGEPATVISNNGRQVVIERGGQRLETTPEALRESVRNGTFASEEGQGGPRQAKPPTPERLAVDDQGQPLDLYHFTTKDAESAIRQSGFDLGKGRARLSDEGVPDAVFFTSESKSPFADNVEFARLRANLNMESPLRVDKREDLVNWGRKDSEYAKLQNKVARYTNDERMRLYRDMSSTDPVVKQRAESEYQQLINDATAARARLTQLLRDKGYDSVIIERDEGGPQATKTYAVLDPKQVRLKESQDKAQEARPSPRFQSVADMLAYERSLPETEQNAFRRAMDADEAVKRATKAWLEGGNISVLSEAHRQFAERYFNQQQNPATEEYLDEPQSKVQSNALAQREAIESGTAAEASLVGNESVSGVPKDRPVQAGETTARSDVSNQPATVREVEPARFYHRDYGEVTESPNQKRVGKGRVRVVAADGSEHVIKRSSMTGAGNQRAVPIRGPEAKPDIESYLEPQKGEQGATTRQVATEAQTPETSSIAEKEDRAGSSSLSQRVRSLSTQAEQAYLEIARTREDSPEFKQVSERHQNLLADLRTAQEQLTTEWKARGQIRGQDLLESADDALRKDFEQNGVKPDDVFELRDVKLSDLKDHDRPFSEAAQLREPHSDPVAAGPIVVKEDLNVIDGFHRADQAYRRGEKTVEAWVPRAKTGERTRTESLSESTFNPAPTAVKNASLSADRAALDLPELAQAEPRRATEVHQRALAANAKDPRKVDQLVNEALNSDRNFTDVETAQLRLRAQEIKNRTSELLREIDATTDPTKLQSQRLELDSLTEEFDRLSQATRKAGTEWGRAGVARQQAIDQDFSLVAMKARLKADKGAPLTEQENARIEELSRKLQAAEQRALEAEQRALQSEFQKQIDHVSRQRKRSETKEALDAEYAQLKSQFAQARAEARNVQSSGFAGLDPEGKITPLLARMAKNRIKAGINSTEKLITELYETVKAHGWTRDDVTEVLRATINEPDTALSRWDKVRQKQLNKQLNDYRQRIATGNFSDPSPRAKPLYTRETLARAKEVEALKAEYAKMRYRATRSVGGKLIDTAIGVGNIPKTLLSMGDVSALLRQGGIGFVQHPVLSTRAARDMLTAFTEHGFANVENAIKSSPDFDLAKRSGVEFTGIDRDDPHLNRREEGYLGSSAIDTLAKGRANPLRAVKVVKDFSERTFVSFLDSQRMRIFEQQAQALRDMGLKGKDLDTALKSQAKYINTITGRGSLGEQGNKYAPALNLAMFSPRLVASRFQFLNKMLNPVAWARMPKSARKLQMADNLKFLAGTAAVLGLAKAAGANVNLDPDDADFLKIKIGNTRFDTLTGLQQPLRFTIRMAKAMRGGETYSGDTKGDIFADFTRSKASPEIGLAWDYLAGQNRLSGKQFEAKDVGRNLVPLPMQDFAEAIKEDGALRGSLEALPSLFGVGVQTYHSAAEKPTTEAEKLARRFIRNKLPDEARDQQQIDLDTKKSELRARARRGEDVSGDLTALGAQLTERQTKAILSARNKSRLQEDVNRLSAEDALLVYSVATPAQRAELKDILQKKSAAIDAMAPERAAKVRQRYEAAGFQRGPLPRIRGERQERSERRSREGYIAP